MFDQQIECLSNKLVKFIQDLTVNIQTINNKKNFNENVFELFQLRYDYTKQLACSFDILITKLLDEFRLHRINQLVFNLDPVQIWRLIQNSIDQLNELKCQDLCLIIKHIHIINHYFYNLLLQLKNSQCFNIDQIRSLNQNFVEELNHLAACLINFITLFYKTNQTSYEKPCNTYLFQNHRPETTCEQNSPNNDLSVPIVYTPEIESLFSSGGIIYVRKSGNTWIAENLATLVDTLRDIGETIDMHEHCEIVVRKNGALDIHRRRAHRKHES